MRLIAKGTLNHGKWDKDERPRVKLRGRLRKTYAQCIDTVPYRKIKDGMFTPLLMRLFDALGRSVKGDIYKEEV